MTDRHAGPDEIPAGAASITWDQVARLYDTYVTATYDLPFYLRETATAGDVLELMCGTGRISLPLAAAGVRLTCVDASPEMLAVLHEKLERAGPPSNIQVVQMDVRQLALNRQFDLVLLPFQSFAELISPADQRQALTRIHQHLRTGGRCICTLHNPALRRKTVDGQLHLLGRFPDADRQTTLLLWGVANYDPIAHVVEGLQFYEEYDAVGVLQHKRLLEMRFALLERDEFAALASSIGFRVAALYGDYDYTPFHEDTSPFMIWVLEK